MWIALSGDQITNSLPTLKSHRQNSYHLEFVGTFFCFQQQYHHSKLKCENLEERIEEIVLEGAPVTPARLQHSNWAKWIQKIYETDSVSSFRDFGDTNFQYPEVPWYPNLPRPNYKCVTKF